MTDTNTIINKNVYSQAIQSGYAVRLDTFDWLSDLPESPLETNNNQYVEISFSKGLRKDFFINPDKIPLTIGDSVVVETGVVGYDIGTVSVKGVLASLQMRRKKYKVPEKTQKILKKATPEDLKKYHECKAKEKSWLKQARITVQHLRLQMKISQVEIQGDGRKATFYYTAEERIDFRELIKHYASDFRVKIEMRHISARQEAAQLGALGSCGRTLCSSTWMAELKPVNLMAARHQSLSINKTKLSGHCGRLKCCLNFELDFYLEALEKFPYKCDSIQTQKGKGRLLKKDIFRNTLTYSFEDSVETLTITEVRQILSDNKKGIYPNLAVKEDALPDKYTRNESGFNSVEEIALKKLSFKKKKKKSKYKGKQF